MTLTKIASAGWSISREAAPHFTGAGSHLQRYAAVLNGAEINSSFYRPHQPQTYARWADSVPEHFRFSVKLPKTITHERRLDGVADLLAAFAAEAGTLGARLGCVLVQLPPSLKLAPALADDFLQRLRGHFDCMIACEARHGSWFSDEASALLQGHGVTRVIADPPAGQPGPYVATTEHAYIRLHGSPRMYYSSYDEDYLAGVAAWLAARDGRDNWCVFDNTASGAALPNALQLRRLLEAELRLRATAPAPDRPGWPA